MLTEPVTPLWVKSSYSNGNQNCVEMTAQYPEVVPVRDSKQPHGPTLVLPRAAWTAFATAVRDGQL